MVEFGERYVEVVAGDTEVVELVRTDVVVGRSLEVALVIG